MSNTSAKDLIHKVNKHMVVGFVGTEEEEEEDSCLAKE